MTSASQSGTPIPPPLLPITRSSQPPPTHVEFLLSQVRANLRYLCEIGGFDSVVYRQIHELLAKGIIDINVQAVAASRSSDASTPSNVESKAEELGKKNAWLRKALTETSILPTTVETALSLTAGPLLSGDQKDAIVQLVEFSQKGMAEKITDPTIQRRTFSGAKTAQSSTAKAVSGWSKGLKEGREKKRSESDEKKERKRREKEEKKQIKAELKRERNEVIRFRQQQMLGSDSNPESSIGMVTSPVSTAGTSRTGPLSMDRNLASLQIEAEGGTSSSSDSEDGDDIQTTIRNHGPINASKWQSNTSSIADTATLTVLSDPITDSASSMGGTNTTFVVEPGLAISCSLVVIKGDKNLGERLKSVREQNAVPLRQASSEVSVMPPPPPAHPEALAIRRQSSGAAPPLGTPQPPIPPRPNTNRLN